MNKLFIFNGKGNCIFNYEWKSPNTTTSSRKNSTKKTLRSLFSFANDLEHLSIEEQQQNVQMDDTPKSKSISFVSELLPSFTRSFTKSRMFTPDTSSQALLNCESESLQDSASLFPDVEPLDSENEQQLVFGICQTLELIMRKMSGFADQEDFLGYKTDIYTLHYFGTATQFRFALLCQKGSNFVHNGRQVLMNLYEGPFVQFVALNSLQPLEEPIRNSKFIDSVKQMLLNKG